MAEGEGGEGQAPVGEKKEEEKKENIDEPMSPKSLKKRIDLLINTLTYTAF